jgi:hypothetical protein
MKRGRALLTRKNRITNRLNVFNKVYRCNYNLKRNYEHNKKNLLAIWFIPGLWQHDDRCVKMESCKNDFPANFTFTKVLPLNSIKELG